MLRYYRKVDLLKITCNCIGEHKRTVLEHCYPDFIICFIGIENKFTSRSYCLIFYICPTIIIIQVQRSRISRIINLNPFKYIA